LKREKTAIRIGRSTKQSPKFRDLAGIYLLESELGGFSHAGQKEGVGPSKSQKTGKKASKFTFCLLRRSNGVGEIDHKKNKLEGGDLKWDMEGKGGREVGVLLSEVKERICRATQKRKEHSP